MSSGVWSGQLEVLKWIAAGVMVADHACSFVVAGPSWVHAVSRLVFPVFAWVVGSGLARVEVAPRLEMAGRCAGVGVLSLPLFWLLRGDRALDVLVLFAAAALVVIGWDTKRWLVAAVGLFVANWCEYGLPGLLVIVSAVWAWRAGTRGVLAYVVAVTGLWVVNGNPWALVGAGLVLGARWVPWRAPRVGRAFYWVYGLQWYGLSLVRILLGVQGG